uniref:Cyclin N-terminal domain-containing protein n=1 Tax=Arcella intermedia TaxID=1963864 RepID=A0A6B2LBK9_9EUKA
MMDTLASPDESTIVSCTAYALHRLIKERPPKACPSKSPLVNLDAFDERSGPLAKDFDARAGARPALREVFEFISELMDNQALSCEVAVMACAFVSRFLRSTSLQAMHGYTWRKIILSALLVSDKLWEDSAVWNSDYRKTFPALSLDQLNALERNFLIALEFNLTLKASTYALYYFEIRSVSDWRSCNMKPLDVYTAKKLEARSRGAEEVVKLRMHEERVKSDNYSPQALPRISLEQFRKSYLDQYTIF